MAKAKKAAGKVSAAVGSASTSDAGSFTAAEIEKSMSDAVTEAMDAGVSDPVKIRDRMMKARETFKASRR